MQTNEHDVTMVGDPIGGGPFTIYGSGFGASGTLVIGGHAIEVTRWSDTRIKGSTRPGIAGEVIINTPSGQRRGTFGGTTMETVNTNRDNPANTPETHVGDTKAGAPNAGDTTLRPVPTVPPSPEQLGTTAVASTPSSPTSPAPAPHPPTPGTTTPAPAPTPAPSSPTPKK